MDDDDAAATALVYAGVSLNCTDEDKYTAMMNAAASGNLHLVKLLRQEGAHLHTYNINKETALDLA